MSSEQKFRPWAKLLKQSGRRSEPDQATTDAVYQAVRAAWENSAQGKGPRWTMWAAVASLAAIAVLVATTLVPPTERAISFQIARVTGEASQWHSDGWRPLAEGDELTDGVRLRTAANAKLAMAGLSGLHLRIDGGSELTLATHGLALVQGAVYLDVTAPGPPHYRVTTALGHIQHIGTRFAVRWQEERLSVMVRDGQVAVDVADAPLHLDAGQAMLATRDGDNTVFDLARHDPAWLWVSEIAPVLNLDGHTVAFFLDWVALESGHDVVYSDNATERAARRVTLAGSVVDMSAMNALQPVLAATRFQAALNNGIIIVTQTL